MSTAQRSFRRHHTKAAVRALQLSLVRTRRVSLYRRTRLSHKKRVRRPVKALTLHFGAKPLHSLRLSPKATTPSPFRRKCGPCIIPFGTTLSAQAQVKHVTLLVKGLWLLKGGAVSLCARASAPDFFAVRRKMSAGSCTTSRGSVQLLQKA